MPVCIRASVAWQCVAGSWENSSPSGLVCGIMRGQRAGRANRAPGRCRAGEGVAWRHYLTGRLESIAEHAARTARLGRVLLAVHILPELGSRLAVDLLQGRERAQDRGVPLGPEVAEEVLQPHPLQQR